MLRALPSCIGTSFGGYVASSCSAPVRLNGDIHAAFELLTSTFSHGATLSCALTAEALPIRSMSSVSGKSDRRVPSDTQGAGSLLAGHASVAVRVPLAESEASIGYTYSSITPQRSMGEPFHADQHLPEDFVDIQ
jgi:hypothetical protein